MLYYNKGDILDADIIEDSNHCNTNTISLLWHKQTTLVNYVAAMQIFITECSS